jgi:2-keto-myo-inositol isomerase
VRVAHTGAATPRLSLEDDIAVAAGIGADGLEIWAPKLGPALERAGPAGLAALLRRHRVAVVSLGPVPDALACDPAGTEETVARVHRLSELARALRAPWIVLTPGERPAGADERDALDEARITLARLAQISERYDVGLALTPDGHPRAAVRTLGAAAAVLDAAARPGLGLAPDTFNLYAARSSPDELKACRPRWLALLRLADAPADVAPESLRDAHRLPPGDGVAPIDRLLALARELGAEPPAVVPVAPGADGDPSGWAKELRERALAFERNVGSGRARR